MNEANNRPHQEAALEETLYTRAAQLLTDPITDSTRKRQNLLLLLSVLSLAVFFGVATLAKISLLGIDLNLAPLTALGGVPSTTATSAAHTALRFSRVLSPVLLYCLLSFWLSLYRDQRAHDYLSGLAQFKIKEAADRDYAISERRRKRQLANIERFQELTKKRSEESAKIQQEIEKIGEEFRRICGPIRDEHAKAFAEFERLRREDAPRDPKLEEKMSGLGAQIEALSEKQDEDLKPLQDRFDALMEDPEIRKLDLKLDAIIVESPGDWKRSVKRGVLLADIGDDVRLWRRLWYWLEVIFPSGLGLLAFVVPLGSIW
jgi:hypothetical protein